MKCLALDTTTDISSIAVADESGVLAQYDFAHRMDLSRRLMPNIISMLKDCGLEMRDIEAVGVSIGPGSFTGLRIGVTTAKTLAQTLGIPIAGIVSLDLLAHQYDYLPDALICPLVKVRKGEVYYAFYRTADGSLERISEYAAGPIGEIIERLSAISSQPSEKTALTPTLSQGEREKSAPPVKTDPGTLDPLIPGTLRIIFCGDALAESVDTLRDALGDRAVPAPAWLSYSKASILVQLALMKIAQGEADDPLSLVPFYIRRSAPEERMADGS